MRVAGALLRETLSQFKMHPGTKKRMHSSERLEYLEKGPRGQAASGCSCHGDPQCGCVGVGGGEIQGEFQPPSKGRCRSLSGCKLQIPV